VNASEAQPGEAEPQSILTHLEELRWRIFRMFIAIMVGGVIAFIFADKLTAILEAPFYRAVPDSELQSLAVAEKWGVLMRVGLFGGLLLASPVVLFQIWGFINPALNARERKWAFPVVGTMVLLFVGGVLFGYWTFPRGLTFLLGIFPGVQTDLQIGLYYSFTLRYLFAFGLAFLYPVFLFAAAAANVVTSAQLAKARRWAILIVVIGAALITPSGDAFTLLALSIPLYLMYEITYWLVRFVLKK
jgi:sec-independent protein translocase protein TatC